MDSKLSNIELKNELFESRLGQIEKKRMESLESVQLAITEIKSCSAKLDTEVKNVKNEFNQLEKNVSSLGDVFDSVKDVVDTNKK